MIEPPEMTKPGWHSEWWSDEAFGHRLWMGLCQESEPSEASTDEGEPPLRQKPAEAQPSHTATGASHLEQNGLAATAAAARVEAEGTNAEVKAPGSKAFQG